MALVTLIIASSAFTLALVTFVFVLVHSHPIIYGRR